MRNLQLDEKLAQSLIGALLSIARVDGIVNAEEMSVLRDSVVGLLTDEEELMFAEEVSPAQLRAVLDAAFARGGIKSTRAEITTAFLSVAHNLAAADGDYGEAEADLIGAYAVALGVVAASVD